MKSSPQTFSFSDLVKATKKTTTWEGVRNYQARNLMRDQIKKGDTILYYHSSTDVPGVVGLATVVREAYEDPYAMDPKHMYFDPKAKKRGTNPWLMVDVKATHWLTVPVDRELMANNKILKTMLVLKRGMRLSVQPVTDKQFNELKKIGKPKRV